MTCHTMSELTSPLLLPACLPVCCLSGLAPEWLDKLHGQEFFSEHPQSTHEHYLQVRVEEIVCC
jgi:hypothetical protein